MENLPSRNEEFVRRIRDLILEHLSDENFGAEELVLSSGISRYKLSKQLSSSTGKNINQFIREVRLEKALEMLREQSFTIAEIAYKTGFSSPAYFNKCFRDMYGYPPGQHKLLPGEDADHKHGESQPGLNHFKKSVIAALIVLLVIGAIFFGNRITFTNSKSDKPVIAVMPFQNMTNDSAWNYWQHAVQHDFITTLSSTGELEVSFEESVNSLLQKTGIEVVSLNVLSARTVSRRLRADFFVTGSIQKSGQKLRIDAHLMQTDKSEVLKSFEANGKFDESEMFSLVDTLRRKITDHMLLMKIIKKNPYYQHLFAAPPSLDAIHLYDKAFKSVYPGEKVKWLRKALRADSTFYAAALSLEYEYSANHQTDSSRIWLIKNFQNRYRMPDHERLDASWAYAYTFSPMEEQIGYLKELVKLDPQNPDTHYLLGLVYVFDKQFANAIPEIKESIAILKRWNPEILKEPKNCRTFKWLGIAYHNTGLFNEERKLYRKAGKFISDHPWFELMQANLSLMKKDTAEALMHIEKSKYLFPHTITEANVQAEIGRYFKDMGDYNFAESYYRKALTLDPDDLTILTLFADYCFSGNRYNDIEFMERGIKLAPDKQTYCEFLIMKGMCLYTNGRREEGKEMIRKAWNEMPFKVYRLKYCSDLVNSDVEL